MSTKAYFSISEIGQGKIGFSKTRSIIEAVEALSHMVECGSRIWVRLAQLDRAFGYGPKGRGFESSNARIEKLRKC